MLCDGCILSIRYVLMFDVANKDIDWYPLCGRRITLKQQCNAGNKFNL